MNHRACCSLPGVAVCILLMALTAHAGGVQWDFSGLASSNGGADLVAGAATPASQPDVFFTTVFINQRPAQVARFTRGTFFRAAPGFAANGGGRDVNRYTLLMDVMFPNRAPTGWAALLQTSSSNANDGEWFVNHDGGVGISGNYGGSVPDGVWHRLALVVDLAAGTYTSYINGVSVQQNTGLNIDGRFSLNAGGDVLLFADEDGENATGYVNSVQLWDRAFAAGEIAALGGPTAEGLPVPEDVSTPEVGVVNHWLFEAGNISGSDVADLAGNHPGSIVGPVNLVRDPDAILLDGSSNYISLEEVADTARLPQRDFSVESWVALDRGTRWGCIVGCIQDNGSFEKGWLLGYNDSVFNLAVSSGQLTYMDGSTGFENGKWYHVVGTYDGASMKLYVNGQLETMSSSQSGDIDYAPAPYVIGAYKDDNEFYPLDGRLNEVRVYDHALSAAEIQQRFQAKKDLFPLPTEPFSPRRGPVVRFDSEGTARISWSTAVPATSVVEYGRSTLLGDEVTDLELKQDHSVSLTGLEPDSTYYYVIRVSGENGEQSSDLYELSTEYDYSVPLLPDHSTPYPDDGLEALYAQAADQILSSSGATQGYCLDYGCGDGRLAYELVRRSDLRVVGVDDDADAVAHGRDILRAAGVYGTRVTLHHAADLGRLPYTKQSMNLIVSDRVLAAGTVPGDAAEMFRVLRPSGGVAFLGQPGGALNPLSQSALTQWLDAAGLDYEISSAGGGVWANVTRAAEDGAGEWSHMYGDPGNSTCSHDTLVRGRNLGVQWFGRPGPRGMVDRQSRNPSPLVVNGRMFVQGNDRLIGQDAYNGTILWSLEIPGMRRVNISRDCGNMCADQNAVFLAVKSECWHLDAGSGELLMTYPVDPLAPEGIFSWGYVATVGDRLLGSRVLLRSAYDDFDGPAKWYDATSGGFGTAMVCNDAVFSVEKGSGERVWEHGGGMILNSTLAAGGGRLYFVESRHPDVQNVGTGRISLSALWQQQFLVALDHETGEQLWEEPLSVATSPSPVVFFLVYANGTLVLSSSTDRYNLYGFAASDGQLLWQKSHGWNRSHHGGHMYHPIVTNDTVFVEPSGYSLSTGQQVVASLPSRGGCSTMSAAANTIIYINWDYHNGGFGFWDLDTSRRTSRAGSRSSCWLSLVSGGGMVLSPTASTGCRCRYPVQTSIGLMAR